jgi:hypothetical protein
MNDKVVLETGKVKVVTAEGSETAYPEQKMIDMLRGDFEPPLGDLALPDGVKFVKWDAPFLCVVHQLPAQVRLLRWIRDDSPVPYGPGALFQDRRLSMPYSITFVIYCWVSERLSLTSYNELYFRNEPLQICTDRLCYPALLNVSCIDAPRRKRAWLCTQNLLADPSSSWASQLGALLDHTWNGAFTLSSEQHEGASWYGESHQVHEDLYPVERWERATARQEAFALHVPWLPAPLNVAETMAAMLAECRVGHRHHHYLLHRRRQTPKSANLVTRFVNYVQRTAAAS